MVTSLGNPLCAVCSTADVVTTQKQLDRVVEAALNWTTKKGITFDDYMVKHQHEICITFAKFEPVPPPGVNAAYVRMASTITKKYTRAGPVISKLTNESLTENLDVKERAGVRSSPWAMESPSRGSPSLISPTQRFPVPMPNASSEVGPYDYGTIECIQLRPGLPFWRMVGSLIHELGHAWIFLYRQKYKLGEPLPGTTAYDMEEGFCHMLSCHFWRERYHQHSYTKGDTYIHLLPIWTARIWEHDKYKEMIQGIYKAPYPTCQLIREIAKCNGEACIYS
ncbi:hypothetical protein GNI_067300 [Gregarina niphandrodes]|uniref:Uncharacterized protein n=1 Tax=Gregarina niphandrodes TaxID=110365 RepID=A0A023B7R4_GRENI|nr:hypothetical protein GNI_067300 [Gregarina niphandrodes]EZG67634.1 hypothetical protein GNI_067300 [Gregarina niphandrodes]|eukprot:XP_011130187.1 hypothetical protein GNI_067300 [Gregarina niphandrodes]